MAISLQNVKVDQFAAVFENVYQAQNAVLPMTVKNVRGVVGETYVSKVAGQFILHDRGAFQSDIPPTDVSYNPVILTLKNKVALVPSDIFEQAEVNASERENLAREAAMAIGRTEDQLIIDDGLVASATPNVVAAGTTNLTVEKMRQAAAIMDRNNVPPMDRFAVIHANNKESLLGETEVTSSDYNTVKALVQGDIDTFLGFKFIMIGNRDEGGLPISGGIRETFFYHKNALLAAYGVLAQGGNPGVDIDWDTRSRSFLVIPQIRMGAKALKNEGIVKVECVES